MDIEDIESSKYYNLYMTNFFMTKGPSWDLDETRAKNAILELDHILEHPIEDVNYYADLNEIYIRFKKTIAISLFSNQTSDDTLKQEAEDEYRLISKDIEFLIEHAILKGI